MGNTANKAQKFLLDNNCGDLILNDTRAKNVKDRIYASDIMMMFLKSERGQNVDKSERQLTIPAVISSFVCGHPPKQTYLNDGIWHCEKCGGKWKSIANK